MRRISLEVLSPYAGFEGYSLWADRVYLQLSKEFCLCELWDKLPAGKLRIVEWVYWSSSLSETVCERMDYTSANVFAKTWGFSVFWDVWTTAAWSLCRYGIKSCN